MIEGPRVTFPPYKQHLGGHRKTDAEHQTIPTQQSPERKAPEDDSRITHKRARSREEEYTKTARRRENPKGKSREIVRRPSQRVERKPSPRLECRPSPRVERRQSPRVERRPSPQDRPRDASPEKKEESYAPNRTTKTSVCAANSRIGKTCTYYGQKHEYTCKLMDHADANKDEMSKATGPRIGLRDALGRYKKGAGTFKQSRGTPCNNR